MSLRLGEQMIAGGSTGGSVDLNHYQENNELTLIGFQIDNAGTAFSQNIQGQLTKSTILNESFNQFNEDSVASINSTSDASFALQNSNELSSEIHTVSRDHFAKIRTRTESNSQDEAIQKSLSTIEAVSNVENMEAKITLVSDFNEERNFVDEDFDEPEILTATAEISVGETDNASQKMTMTPNKTTFTGNVDFRKATVTGIADVIYPVGSIYIGIQAECPMKAVIQGSEWVKVSEGRVLQGSDSSHTAGTTISAGLPNITGNFNFQDGSNRNIAVQATKAFKLGSQVTTGGATATGTITRYNGISFDASRESSIYGNSTTVQPPAFVVNIWQRTA